MLTIAPMSALALDTWLLLDLRALHPEAASAGRGLDGEPVALSLVHSICESEPGPVAYRAVDFSCGPLPMRVELPRAVLDLPISVFIPGARRPTVAQAVAAGFVVVVEPTLGVACIPGDCPFRVPVPPVLPVSGPVISEFTAVPPSFEPDTAVELAWSAVAESCLLTDGGIDTAIAVATVGQQTVFPDRTTVWTLVCENPAGEVFRQVLTQATGSVTIDHFSTSEAVVRPDDPVTLYWGTTGATNCEITGDGQTRAVTPQGRLTVTVATDTRFDIACSGSGQSATAALEVMVSDVPGLPEIGQFDAIVTKGVASPAHIVWSSAGATFCELADSVRGIAWRVATSGELDFVPADDGVLTLSCRNAVGTSRASVDVAPTRPFAQDLIDEFAVQPVARKISTGAGQAWKIGAPVALRWSAVTATDCVLSSDRAGVMLPLIGTAGEYLTVVEQPVTYRLDCIDARQFSQAFLRLGQVGDFVFAGDFER